MCAIIVVCFSIAFNRTLAPSITIGSESLCEIEEPSTSDNIRGGIVALIVLPIIIFIACVVVVAILTISIVCAKKSKRRARQRQAAVGPIGYNPQAPTGQAVYMVPVNQIPPTGILLVPPQVSLEHYSNEVFQMTVYTSLLRRSVPCIFINIYSNTTSHMIE